MSVEMRTRCSSRAQASIIDTSREVMRAIVDGAEPGICDPGDLVPDEAALCRPP
jgi:hypothetical protein